MKRSTPATLLSLTTFCGFSLFTAVALSGCSGSADAAGDELGEEEVSSSEDAHSFRRINPASWDHQAAANLECNATVRGVIPPRSSKHYYSFPGLAGTPTTFTVDGYWPASLGARVIVTDTRYRVLASARSERSARVRVGVTFAASAKHFVFVAPIRAGNVSRRFDYELTGACQTPGCTSNAECAGGEQCLATGAGNRCTARPLCVQVTTPEGKFAAKNFEPGQYAEANTWGETTAAGGPWGISLASCDVVSANLACTEEYAPVCAVTSGASAAQTFSNGCDMRRAVIGSAGSAGDAIAISTKGVCAAPGNPVCGTYYIQPPLASSPVYYVSNWNSEFEANAWIALNPSATSPVVLSGACDAFPICTKEYNPVCGVVKSGEPKTYGNRCGFQVAVRDDAGSTTASKGYYTPGACPR